MSDLNQLATHFTLADFLDIFVFTGFTYLILNWMRQRVSHVVIIGFAGAGFLYVLAHQMQMYLTLRFFQMGFAVMLFSLVVIFQEDLRRGFGRLTAWKIKWPGRTDELSSKFVDTLVEAVKHFANQKIGALLVLKGREPLETHVRGGIRLDGQISLPLLYSLFDSSTPGHDGAGVIQGEVLESFGVHLPLSKNLDQLTDRGTRHTAALGLAERADVLVIVVSEERGTICAAQNGILKEVSSLADLNQQITTFRQRHHPQYSEGFLAKLIPQLPLFLLSLGLAGLLWGTFAYQVDQVEQSLEHVKIEYRNLPKGLVLGEDTPAQARLDLTGSERAVRVLEPGKLTISVDLKGFQEGVHSVKLGEKSVELPKGVTLRTSDSHLLKIPLYRQIEVPVLPVVDEATVPKGYVLGELTPTPATVKLLIRSPGKPVPETLKTEPISLAGVQDNAKLPADLEALPDYLRFPNDQPPVIQVTVGLKTNGDNP